MIETTRDSARTKQMTGVVLAGGRSSRMGRDKSAVAFGGEPMLLRAVRALQGLFGEVVVVSNQEIPFEVPARVVGDDVPYQGPLGGIIAGLKAASNDVCFVVAVDMPFISEPVIEHLAQYADEADVVLPLTASGTEPLFAFYNRRCLPKAQEILARGERKILSMLAELSVRVVGYSELSHLDGADKTFTNINNDFDLEKAEAQMKKPKAAEVERDRMPVEKAATIYLNSKELVTVQSSMEHLDELACGFLVAEGILQDRAELESVRVDEQRGEIRVRTTKSKDIAANSMGKRFVTSGCGKGFSFVSLGDAMGIAPIRTDYRVSRDNIPGLMKQFLRESGRAGMHASAIVKDDGLQLVRHDIGRHNTVDMILGKLWLDGNADRDIMLFTTGRISYEMVVKAAKARIPVVVSRTAATDLAVRLADRVGVEVIGYVRAGNMQVYTGGERIKETVM